MSSLIQRSFSGGEISPELYSRADTAKYSQGLKTCRNWVVNSNGSVSTRPGTVYVDDFLLGPSAFSTLNFNVNCRLIPFYQRADQNYILIFSSGIIFFLKDGKYIKETEKSISAITNANPAVVTSNAHGYQNAQYVFLRVDGMSEINGQYFQIDSITANTYQLKNSFNGNLINSTGFGVYTPGGGGSRVYQTPSQYLDKDLPYLKYAQAGDVLTLTHPLYPVREVSYITDINWTYGALVFDPTIGGPASVTVTGGIAGPTGYAVQVTAVSSTGEESYPRTSGFLVGQIATAAAPIFISWPGVTGAVSYNIYSFVGGGLGYIGTAQSASFVDSGYIPDFSARAPVLDQLFFNDTGLYPSAVVYHQQRLTLAGTNSLPQTVWMSKPGIRENFTVTTPSQSNDGLQFSIISKSRSNILGAVSADFLFIFTDTSEYLINGDNADIIRPSSINARQISNFGSSRFVSPILVGSSIVFVQASSGLLFELDHKRSSSNSGGLNLNTFSSHLVKNFSIVDMEYQKSPQSIIWACRNDGTLLGCTYDKDQKILAWHRHDTDGVFQNIVSIPENPKTYTPNRTSWPIVSGSFEEGVYFVTRRSVNGFTRRFIEKFSNRNFNSISDFVGSDCSTQFDLAPSSTGNITISGGVTWDDGETLTATFSLSNATASLVGQELRFTSSDGTKIRFRILNFISPSEVTGMVNRLIPVDLRNLQKPYVLASKIFSGLSHLEGKQVSVFADGQVVASPNNDGYPIYTVTNGTLTLDTAATKLTVGLPFTSDIKTLNVDNPSGETISDKKQLVTRVTLDLIDTRGLFVGAEEPTGSDPLANLMEMKLSDRFEYDDTISLLTGKGEVQIQGTWNESGSVFIRQVDPLPATIGSITPAGQYAFKNNKKDGSKI